MARKGRARRFREARELKQGFDDGLFEEKPSTSLADLDEGEVGWKTLEDDNSDNTPAERITDTTNEDYDPLMD